MQWKHMEDSYIHSTCRKFTEFGCILACEKLNISIQYTYMEIFNYLFIRNIKYILVWCSITWNIRYTHIATEQLICIFLSLNQNELLLFATLLSESIFIYLKDRVRQQEWEQVMAGRLWEARRRDNFFPLNCSPNGCNN